MQTPGIEAYHHIAHLVPYDTEGVRYEGAELELVMGALDELLYPEDSSHRGVRWATASTTLFTGYFHGKMARVDPQSWSGALEVLDVHVDHSRYLGKTALVQSYKVKIDEQIPILDRGMGRITTMYYLEMFSGTGQKFAGSILRPQILRDHTETDEPMCAYDCEQLFDDITDLKAGLESQTSKIVEL